MSTGKVTGIQPGNTGSNYSASLFLHSAFSENHFPSLCQKIKIKVQILEIRQKCGLIYLLTLCFQRTWDTQHSILYVICRCMFCFLCVWSSLLTLFFQLYSDITGIEGCVSLRCTTCWFDTRICSNAITTVALTNTSIIT